MKLLTLSLTLCLSRVVYRNSREMMTNDEEHVNEKLLSCTCNFNV